MRDFQRYCTLNIHVTATVSVRYMFLQDFGIVLSEFLKLL